MITFPTTTEKFIEYQEDGTGRKLTEFEREFSEVLVDLINGYYEDGKDGLEALNPLDEIETFYAARGRSSHLENPAVRHIHQMMNYWCMCAHRAGKEAAQHETDRSAQED